MHRTPFVVSVLLAAPTALAADLHVPAAHPTIQAAIDAAVAGDHVVVADGVYAGAGNVNLDFGGKDITVRSALGPDGCTLDGSGTPGAHAFIFSSGESAGSRLEGLTLSGFATGAGNEGAIRCVGGSPTIFDCVFLDCSTADAPDPTPAGSAIFIGASSAVIQQCRFENNEGAPVFLDAASVNYLIDCTFRDNLMRSVNGEGGGAVQSKGFALSFSSHYIDNTVVAISGPARGGAIAHLGSMLDLTGSVFEGNGVSGPADAAGAAVYMANDFVINGGIFRNHLGAHGGGTVAVDGTGLATPIVPFLSGLLEDNTVGGILIDDPAGMTDVRLGGATFCGNSPYNVSGSFTDFGANSICCPGDVDTSTKVDVVDLLAVLARWGLCAGCLEDVDESGAVDVSDLLSVLATWGDCPVL